MIGGVIIAAGASRRMGQPKQLLDLGGRPLLAWPLAALRRVAPAQLVLVLGHEAPRIAAALDLEGVRVVVNERYAEGQSTSLHLGLDALDPAIEATLLLTGDQPFVDADLLTALVAAYRAGGHGIVATAYATHTGAPLLLAREIWALAQGIGGDQGARALLRAHPQRVTTVPASDGQTALDVDTPEQYEAVLRALSGPQWTTNTAAGIVGV